MGSLFNVDGVTGNLTTAGSITSTSTTSGFLLPSMTTTQRNAIPTPTTGLEIFNTTTNQSEFWNGSAWVAIGGSTSPASPVNSIQYNNAEAFGGNAVLTFNSTSIPLALNLDAGASVLFYNSDGTTEQGTIFSNGSSDHSIGLQAGADVVLISNNDASDFTWTFDSSGVLTTPSNIQLLNTGEIFFYQTDVNSTITTLSIDDSNNFFITPGNASSQWAFNVDGGFVLPNLATQPGTPATGEVIYNSTLNKLQVWNGSAWAEVGGSTPAGSNTQIQYNSSGAFGASSNFTYDGSTLTVGSTSHSETFLILNTDPTGGGVFALRQSGGNFAEIDFDNADGSVTYFNISSDTLNNLSLMSGPSSSPSATFLFNADKGFELLNQGFVEFDDTGSNSVSIAAPATVTASYNLYWPVTQGAANSYMQNDGAGNLSFATTMNFDSGDITSDGSGNLTAETFIAINEGLTFPPANLGVGASTAAIQSQQVGTYCGVITLVEPDSGVSAKGFISFDTIGTGFPQVAIDFDNALTLGVDVSSQLGPSTRSLSALFQMDSTTQGFLLPRMTTTQKNAISSPATGLVVFDSTLGKLCVFSTTWQTITSA